MTVTISGTTGLSAASVNAAAINGGTGTGNMTSYTTAVTPLPGTNAAWTATHSLGVVPAEAVMELTCLTADTGYAVGDVVQNPSVSNGTNNFTNAIIYKNTTTVGVFVQNTLNVQIPNKTTGAITTPTAANWSYRFRLRAA